jgi:hypothetical protein
MSQNPSDSLFSSRIVGEWGKKQRGDKKDIVANGRHVHLMKAARIVAPGFRVYR